MSTLFALRWPFRCSVLAVCACALLSAPPLFAQAPDTLTRKDIDDAIRWGMDGDPTPYLLHHEGPPGNSNSVIVGAIYTPFLRVALAAKAARSAGHDFASEDVTHSLIEPVIYIAFRWYCCVDPDHGNDLASWNPSTAPVDYKIATPGDRVARSHSRLRVTASPLSISRDISLLASFGGDLPYRDVVLIATYPVSVLPSAPNFVIYREWPSPSVRQGKTTSILVGKVTPQDVTRWR
jgi:hypothetical protein